MKPQSLLNASLKKDISRLIKNKTLLVTGGTGSFGKIIVAQLLQFDPKLIIIYSRTEDKQVQMMHLYKNEKRLQFQLGDVRDIDSLRRVMQGVDYVFHAAAQKQVPVSEYNVLEAVKTNIIGAQNVIDVCREYKVKKAIAISTDKAVEPVNAMGMTKALQEKLFIQANVNQNGQKTIFACARYGNVMGSTGSVIPLFSRLIKNKQPLTLTHKDMTRFILTLEHAVELVFIAIVQAKGGEIFIPDIPTHTVKDLAEVMLEIHNEKELKILETGIRVGEKIHETLITPTESIRTLKKKGFYIIMPEIELEGITKKHKLLKNPSMFRFASDNAQKITKEELKEIILEANLVNKSA